MSSKYFLLFLLISSLLLKTSNVFGFDDISWIKSYEEGLKIAKEEKKPAFIYFYAPWCSWCYVYEQETLGNKRITNLIQKNYIPILVNFDARPDLVKKYRGFGLPLTIILSYTGELVLRLPGILTPQDMELTLQRVIEVLAVKDLPEINIITEVNHLDAKSYQDFLADWLEHLEGLYDPVKKTLSGILSSGATLKRPAPKAWAFKLKNNLWTERTEPAALAVMNNIFDSKHGGFFYFRDLHRADKHLETAKLVHANAWLIYWFSQAGKKYNNPLLTQAAQDSIHYLKTTLWDKKTGGFFQAQVSDYTFYKPNPTTLSPPPLDIIKRTDSNAIAALVFIKIAKLTADDSLAKLGSQTLDYLMTHHLQDSRLYQSIYENTHGVAYNLPKDIFWLLAAMQTATEAGLTTFATPEQKQQIYKLANQWLSTAMQGKYNINLSNQLLGIIAWVAVNSDNPLIPTETTAWALKQIRIEENTRPDELVYALKAWQIFLIKEYQK